MAQTSFEFIDASDLIFRKKIEGCYVSIAKIMDKYRKHVAENTKENQKNASDFLKEDFLLNIMVDDFDCREDVVSIMKEYAEAVPD
jgi:hypothetical protein